MAGQGARLCHFMCRLEFYLCGSRLSFWSVQTHLWMRLPPARAMTLAARALRGTGGGRPRRSGQSRESVHSCACLCLSRLFLFLPLFRSARPQRPSNAHNMFDDTNPKFVETSPCWSDLSKNLVETSPTSVETSPKLLKHRPNLVDIRRTVGSNLLINSATMVDISRTLDERFANIWAKAAEHGRISPKWWKGAQVCFKLAKVSRASPSFGRTQGKFGETQLRLERHRPRHCRT